MSPALCPCLCTSTLSYKTYKCITHLASLGCGFGKSQMSRQSFCKAFSDPKQCFWGLLVVFAEANREGLTQRVCSMYARELRIVSLRSGGDV